jgi:hypothetical protein
MARQCTLQTVFSLEKSTASAKVFNAYGVSELEICEIVNFNDFNSMACDAGPFDFIPSGNKVMLST